MNSQPSSMHRIQLTKVQETLLITLLAKAHDYRSKDSILRDAQADRIVRDLGYDFSKVGGFGDDLLVVRAKHYDEWLRDFLKKNPEAIVLNVGCGLDARITRIDPSPKVSWFDVDYPEVVELRKSFYEGRDGYRMIGSSLAEAGWMNELPKGRPAILISDGVLEYLTQEQVRALFNRVTDRFPHGGMEFDVMTPFAVKSAQRQLHDENGPLHKWSVEELREVDELDARLRRIEELSLFASPYIRRLPLRSRLFYGLMRAVPRLRKMLRMVMYEF